MQNVSQADVPLSGFGFSCVLQVVEELQSRIRMDPPLFDFGTHTRHETPPLLLILDRRDDPVTPLLTQWTYHAMVHELIGTQNNRVKIGSSSGGSAISPGAPQEVVLSAERDKWFKDNMFSNYGELGANVKVMLDEYASKSQNNAKIESIGKWLVSSG
jgi:vacuolar protein sorting-associated protein 45